MRDPSPYAGQTVKLRPDAAELGGHTAEVVDWHERMDLPQESAGIKAEEYRMRAAMAGLPDDGETLYARVDGIMRIIHATEIEGHAPPMPSSGLRSGPVEARDVGATCPACERPIESGQMVTVVVLGPGGDPQARSDARDRKPYNAAAIDVHWACATGDESYDQKG
jgi:hypothetical protein